MAQLYHLVKRNDPATPSDNSTGLYYASRLSMGQVSTETLAKELAEEAGQSQGSVLGLLEDLNNEIVEQLLMGYKVRLGNIGLLGLRFFGTGSATEEEYSTDNINNVRIKFVPSTALKSKIAMDSGNVTLVEYSKEEDSTESES